MAAIAQKKRLTNKSFLDGSSFERASRIGILEVLVFCCTLMSGGLVRFPEPLSQLFQEEESQNGVWS